MTDTLPREVDYLQRYDQLNEFIKNYIEMPDKMISLLIRFLEQSNGKLSMRGLGKEFAKLADQEVEVIEEKYAEVFFRNE